jgi:hypothetical protein
MRIEAYLSIGSDERTVRAMARSGESETQPFFLGIGIILAVAGCILLARGSAS